MGQTKQNMMDEEDNNDLIGFLKILSERGEFKGALDGIVKQVFSKGVNSMSQKQKDVVDSYVENYKSKNVCEICLNGNVSTLTDYIEIAEQGLCTMCQYDKEKFMRD